jgi:hypothetical protein
MPGRLCEHPAVGRAAAASRCGVENPTCSSLLKPGGVPPVSVVFLRSAWGQGVGGDKWGMGKPERGVWGNGRNAGLQSCMQQRGGPGMQWVCLCGLCSQVLQHQLPLLPPSIDRALWEQRSLASCRDPVGQLLSGFGCCRGDSCCKSEAFAYMCKQCAHGQVVRACLCAWQCHCSPGTCQVWLGTSGSVCPPPCCVQIRHRCLGNGMQASHTGLLWWCDHHYVVSHQYAVGVQSLATLHGHAINGAAVLQHAPAGVGQHALLGCGHRVLHVLPYCAVPCTACQHDHKRTATGTHALLPCPSCWATL